MKWMIHGLYDILLSLECILMIRLWVMQCGSLRKMSQNRYEKVDEPVRRLNLGSLCYTIKISRRRAPFPMI